MISVDAGSSGINRSWILDYGDETHDDNESKNLRTHSIVSGILRSISVLLYLLPYWSNNNYYNYNFLTISLLGLL